MKSFLSVVLSVLSILLTLSTVLASACSGSPVDPTRPTVPSVPPGSGSGTSSSALAISPKSVVMGVGESVVFTASGGDGYNYVFTPVQPGYAFETTWISYKEIRVTMFFRSDVSPVRVDLDGVEAGGLKTVTAIINVR